jgi:glutathione synthase/RimK-type ligase-like ATP-grasp enzyme
MAQIRIIGKKGSLAVKGIIEGTGIQRYRGNKTGAVDAIINYGLAGDRLEHFFRLYPSARKVLMLNKGIGRAKFSAIQDAERHGIKVPKSRLTLPVGADVKGWIEKRQNSIGGIGIKQASKNRTRIPGKYFQEFIKDRRYEIRVHAFSWTKDWSVQKRRGSVDEIAWNFHNGGVFSAVRSPKSYKIFKDAIEISKKILEIRHMSFGAVDFIVDKDLNLYFIEINSAPGFQELSKNIYINAFKELKEMKSSDLRKLV